MWYIDHTHWVRGWLLSNHFCKACQNCLHPSFAMAHKAVRTHHCCFVVKVPRNAIKQHKQRLLKQNQFDMFLLNLLLCSHQWPNMTELCTKLKETNYVIMYWNQFCYIFCRFWEIMSQTGVTFYETQLSLYSKLGKINFDMFYKNDCWAVICYPICVTNVSYEREIIVLPFPVISVVILIFVFQIFEIKSGFHFYWLTL